jgi:hypothetical protein
MGKFDYEGNDYKFLIFSTDEKPVEPAKVEPTLEEALKNIIIERKN